APPALDHPEPLRSGVAANRSTCDAGAVAAPGALRPSRAHPAKGLLTWGRERRRHRRIERRLYQLAHRPDVIRHAEGHGGRAAKRLMDSADVVPGDMERDDGPVVLDLPREAQR